MLRKVFAVLLLLATLYKDLFPAAMNFMHRLSPFFCRALPFAGGAEALLHDAVYDRRLRLRQGGLSDDDHLHRRGRLRGTLLRRRPRARGTPRRPRARVLGLGPNFQVISGCKKRK